MQQWEGAGGELCAAEDLLRVVTAAPHAPSLPEHSLLTTLRDGELLSTHTQTQLHALVLLLVSRQIMFCVCVCVGAASSMPRAQPDAVERRLPGQLLPLHTLRGVMCSLPRPQSVL